jgi:hypothetical protein
VIIAPERTRSFVNQTTVVNNIVVQNNVVINRGPDVRMIERASGRPVRQQPIEQVARVAPFQHVSRADLAVSAQRGRPSPRVATPVPESRPLPVSGQYARPGHQGRETVPGENVTQYRAPHARETQAPSREVTPDSGTAKNNRPAVEHAPTRPHETTAAPSAEAQRQHRPEPSVQAQPRSQPQSPKAQPQPPRAQPGSNTSPKKSQPEKKKQNPNGGGSDAGHDH